MELDFVNTYLQQYDFIMSSNYVIVSITSCLDVGNLKNILFCVIEYSLVHVVYVSVDVF